MASSEADEDVFGEVSEDVARPGIRWRRDWYRLAYAEEHSGFLSISCTACGPVSLGGFTFYEEEEEAERRVALVAVADAHALQRHAQLSLFSGREQQ